MEKKKRLAVLEKIIAKSAAGDQETLKELLGKAGVRVSQAGLSRDLKALGAVRIRRPGGGYAYQLPAAPPAASTAEAFRRRFVASVKGVARSSVMVLLFTPPGEAQLIGRLLDESPPDGLLGTVAGDDTILAVARSDKAARTLEKKFKEIIR
ncbi:MAG: arginine repressor [Planctomycetota bacterium]